MQGRGRPHQVDGVEGRPRRVQVRLDGADPVGHAETAGSVPEVVQHAGGDAQGGCVGSLEALEEGEGAGAGSAAQVGDPARGLTTGRLVEPADDEDVVIRPQRDEVRGMTIRLLSRSPGRTA
jgi:hypothetical protein